MLSLMSAVRSVQGEVNSAADEPEVILLWQRLPCELQEVKMLPMTECRIELT